jgi:hypothetical protein
MEPRPRYHVFVDFSNFWTTLAKLRQKNKVQPRSIPESNYRKIIETLRSILYPQADSGDVLMPLTRLAVGSVKSTEQVNETLWKQVRHEFNCNLYLRAADSAQSDSSTKEIGVDVAIHAQILRKICDIEQNPRGIRHVMILLTGDGNDNQNSGGVPDGFIDPTTFMMCVDLALLNGWEVRMFAWECSCSGTFKAKVGTEGFTLTYLENTALKEFVFRESDLVKNTDADGTVLNNTGCYICGRDNHIPAKCKLQQHPDANHDPSMKWQDTEKAKLMNTLVKYPITALPIKKGVEGGELVAWEPSS